jgi:hypothetical protein
MKYLVKRAVFVGLALMGLQGAHTAAMPILAVITGADMVGIEVEAYFGGSSEVAIWGATSTDSSVANGEGFAGAASGTGWSLSQQGFTLGNVSDTGSRLGLWTFGNFTGDFITRFTVRGLPGSIVFDVSDLDGPEGTPGSGVGRAFLPESDAPVLSAFYSDQFSAPDLFSTLDVVFQTGIESHTTVDFFADTDAVVPAPATLLLMTAGLFAFARRRKAAA